VVREDGERDLGKIVLEGHMCRADERELIADAKGCVAIEINSVDVGGYGCGLTASERRYRSFRDSARKCAKAWRVVSVKAPEVKGTSGPVDSQRNGRSRRRAASVCRGRPGRGQSGYGANWLPSVRLRRRRASDQPTSTHHRTI
jgi:hypothetical protein